MRDFSRQSFLGKDSGMIFARVKIGVVGLGGGGSHIVLQLAHIGVLNYVVVDPDVIDDSNLNRLVGGTAQDVADSIPKVRIADRIIRGVNPTAKVMGVPDTW